VQAPKDVSSVARHPMAYGRLLAGAGTVALISRNAVGNGRWWSQVVAVELGVPANVVAVWSQSGAPTQVSDP
jgi:hypothetical protein